MLLTANPPLAPAFHLVQPTLGKVLEEWDRVASKMTGNNALEALLVSMPSLRLCLPNNNNPKESMITIIKHLGIQASKIFGNSYLRSTGFNKEARIRLLSRPATPGMMTKMALTQAYGDAYDHFSAEAKKNQEPKKSKATRDFKVHAQRRAAPARLHSKHKQHAPRVDPPIHPLLEHQKSSLRKCNAKPDIHCPLPSLPLDAHAKVSKIDAKAKAKTTGGNKPPSQEVKRMRVTKAMAESLGYKGKGVVVAELLKLANHPSLPDTLVATVATGSSPEQEYQVVVRADVYDRACRLPHITKVAFAPAGSKIADDLGIDTTEVRAGNVKGVQTGGIFCSEKNLGVGHGNRAIILPDTSVVGTDAVHAYIEMTMPEVQTVPRTCTAAMYGVDDPSCRPRR